MAREKIKNYKRWVVKVGSALLTDNGQGLNKIFIQQLAEQLAFLRQQNVEVLLVSSGSVAAGLSQLKMKGRPEKLNTLQAAAAVGQASLIRHYEEAFKPYSINIAQVLLTHSDISNRERYLNAKNTLSELLHLGVLAVINENDTVATEEICVGDNDNLAALVSNLVGAELMVILTDQDGFFTADPRIDESATLLHQVDASDDTLKSMASGASSVGRGGMVTKLMAAQTASLSGSHTIIANGGEANIIQRLFDGEQIGTLFNANERLNSKKQWMAGQLKITGEFRLDEGAINVIKVSGKSLLPVGVTQVGGDFRRGELVSCVDAKGKEIARGLTNYNSAEAEKIIGKPSNKIFDILGYGGDSELIHRDNLVLV